MQMTKTELQRQLRLLANPVRARTSETYFQIKSGKVEAGNHFLGVPVPESRRLARMAESLSFSELRELARSTWHEERLCAFLILIRRYQKAKNPKEKNQIARFALTLHRHANNWDLVDLIAPHVYGPYFIENKRPLPSAWIRSKKLWPQRLAVLSTFAFLRAGRFEPTLNLCRGLLQSKEDLLHKACGWMLRELGKRDQRRLETFLRQHHQNMPRTMLRYAIEKFPEKKRQAYLKGRIR